MTDNITEIVGNINNTISGSINNTISGSVSINGTYPSLTVGVHSYFDNTTQTVLNQSYLFGQQGVTPMPIFILLAGVAFIFLILAFKEPIRSEMGNINVSKVGLSLCGLLMSTVAALASFNIADNMGSGVSTYGIYTVGVSSYIIWNSQYITAALIISGMLCAIMFIYTLLQPESIKPSTNEYKNNATNTDTASDKK